MIDFVRLWHLASYLSNLIAVQCHWFRRTRHRCRDSRLHTYIRYVMVKYADRGLVEKGSVSPLFETLYLVMCLTLLSVFLIFGFYYNLNKDPDKTSNFHLMCRRKSVDWSNFDAMKSITLMLALTLPLVMILISMFIAILFFLQSRGMSKKVPPIFGKYRRNILSLQETFVYMIICFLNFYMNSFLLKFHNRFGFSVDMIRIYGFSSSLVTNNLLEGTLWPLFILWNLSDKMPDLYSDTKKEKKYKTFYITGHQNIEPRRFYENRKVMQSRKKNSTKCFTFLGRTNTSHSILDLPSIV